MTTILDILAAFPADRPAIRSPGRRDLDGRNLRRSVDSVRAAIPGGLDDRRVAIIGPDTAETAVLLLAVAAHATAAPLHRQFTVSEFVFEYQDLGVDFVLVHASGPSAALEAAGRLGLPVARYDQVKDAAAGVVEISGVRPSARPAAARSRAGVALVLHTSGTTGKPKIVPLLEDRITISAGNIARALCLDGGDCVFSVMPLFHTHAILNVLMPSLLANASVSYAGTFDPLRVFEWLTHSGATWISAVPAIHAAMLARAQVEGRTAFPGLRFVRSSSAPLPVSTRAALERFYDAPVLESYGMTEVEQIASQELPPVQRKPGSVGRSGGPRIRILAPDDRDVPSGVVGEVCVSGPNCFPGYEDNAAATRAAFIGEFFRTGDLGRMDEDGHLFLVGRAKEIIIRGGENIAPIEIDDAINDHPAVAEAAAFGFPHPAVGEEIGLAVVARGARPSPAELIAHAARRLAPFKLPARVAFVDRLPRGPTGKLQRRALAEKLKDAWARDAALTGAPDEAPIGPLEAIVAEVWSEVLGVKAIGRRMSFSSLGGSSHTAAKVLIDLERRLGRAIPLAAIIKAETVAQIAEAVAGVGDHEWSPAKAS